MLVTGLLVATLGVAMLLPALVDLAADNKDWMIFASSGTMTTLVGLGLFAPIAASRRAFQQGRRC
jgi:trk system potassium uptake protein TrkH